MIHVYNDGGREAAGFKGRPRDCVARAVAIATGKPYAMVWTDLAKLNRKAGKHYSADKGVRGHSPEFKAYLKELGYTYVALPRRKVIREVELPKGNLIVMVTSHAVACIDGVFHDTHDFSPAGLINCFGYYAPTPPKAALYEVYKGDVKLSRNPMNLAAAETMRDLFLLNYKSQLNIKPYEN